MKSLEVTTQTPMPLRAKMWSLTNHRPKAIQRRKIIKRKYHIEKLAFKV